MDLLIGANVLNKDVITRKLAGSPAEYRRAVFGWLLRENSVFIGTRTKPGIIRRKVLARKRWSDGGSWRSQVVGLIKGRVVDPMSGQVVTRAGMESTRVTGGGLFGAGVSMRLQMGVLYRSRKKIHEALEFLEGGGTVSSDKYMPVPVKGSGMSKAYEKFKHWLSAGMFTVVYRGNMAFYFLKRKGPAQRSDLKFVGFKRVGVKFNIGLRPAFESRIPEINAAGQVAIDKATRGQNNV
jgi:hypothetical protein